MWIVRLALRRPYTFVVMAMLVLILGVLCIVRMPKDIFPNIDIPVVSVIWTYQGASPEEIADRIVTGSERAMTTTINDVEHIESQSYNGIAVIRVFFQPNVKIAAAVAQVTAINQTILRLMPPGITPPLILQYSATNVPMLQAGLQSNTLSPSSRCTTSGSTPFGCSLRRCRARRSRCRLAGRWPRSWSISCCR